jgi:2-methylcitrate dehydratase
MNYDSLLVEIADYVHDTPINSDLAYKTAHLALLDSMGCLLLAQNHPKCKALLGPIVPGTKVPKGVRIPGTAFELDPVKAAFDIGCCIRWLDFNDTWLAKEWAHPSDNLGGILAIADFLRPQLTMQDVLTAMIKAYEIQGVLALQNSFNQVGLDHVILVKVATTAVVSQLLGLSKTQIMDAISNAWIDNGTLRSYRHAPNTGSRKSWAAGDATSRALLLAWMVSKGEQGYPNALKAKRWGFEDVVMQGKKIILARPLQSYVMENILFKVAFPAEFHAQTAVEVALNLYSKVKDRWDDIERIELTTQEPAVRIIHKEGPLHNYADRDHCLQYMVAVGLFYGEMTAEHYSDKIAENPQLDKLRQKMVVKEDKQFTEDYYHPDKRSIANAIQIFYKDGTKTEQVRLDFPLGHKRRREEALGLLKNKFVGALKSRYSEQRVSRMETLWDDPEKVSSMTVSEFMDLWVIS